MLTKTLKFDEATLDTLRAMQWSDDGTSGKIVTQLDRAAYVKVNKALEAMGGTWNRKAGAHLFSTDPRPQVEGLLQTGGLIVARDGFFETPDAVIDRMFELAQPIGEVLEPSAGMGAIARRIARDWVDASSINCVELNPQRAHALGGMGFGRVYEIDFMDFHIGGFDSIFMNPPFENLQDVDHVRHAYDLLAEGGELVAVMSESPFFRNDKKAVDFRAWLDEIGGYSEQLPAGSFKESGTGVNARLVLLQA